ncbi:MAG: murein L,D-transpeptidase catalytic domain family protein [Pseudomonadota bacterium]|nr:murein L,D-transpeptidase catalytic domain family protein [Gammaproteobacteria bacterium]MBU1926304.1 murein L,D-transpeptidase catalytic domain family protein [Gammaproteobacteria bacterium]MBU2545619.1 murein L,D-transpeptidase catalytic domain family protein [Gammaproteobacteria bacterium]
MDTVQKFSTFTSFNTHSLKRIFQILLLGTTFISFNLFAFQTSSDSQKILNQANGLNPQVLNVALKAYQHARNMGLDKQQILTIIDYSKPSSDKRLWVIDLKKDQVDYSVHVAHGKDSGNNYAHFFSDQPRSLASCIGVIETGATYQGEHGYSLRLKGLEKGYNDTMYSRAVVMHSAWYVTPSFLQKYGRLGRSWGCPALNPQSSTPIINTIKDGTIIVAYYPDQSWLTHSKFLA